MRMLLFMLSLVLLTACGPDAPENIPERIKENCQREFGGQGQRAVDNCIRWSEVPPTSR
jgi:hypothetical protein